MERTVILPQQERLIHNAYCPTVEQTIATCEAQFVMLHEQQNTYFEVPFEQFDDVYHYFHQNDVIKKGAFTYRQVWHNARTGNIHQLKMSQEGCIYFADGSISVSAAISFAQSKWNGATREEALENAVLTGLNIIGEAFAEEVITLQIKHANVADHIKLDAGLKEAVQKNSTKAIVKEMAAKATENAGSLVVNKVSLPINGVEIGLVTGMMASVDSVRTIAEEMSSGKLFKNVSKTVESVAGSRIAGSLLTNKVTKKMLGFFMKEEEAEMLGIFNEELAGAAETFLLNEQELKQALNDFNVVYNLDDELRKMYTAADRVGYAQSLIESELSRIVKLRMYLQVPTNEEMYKVIERMYIAID